MHQLSGPILIITVFLTRSAHSFDLNFYLLILVGSFFSSMFHFITTHIMGKGENDFSLYSEKEMKISGSTTVGLLYGITFNLHTWYDTQKKDAHQILCWCSHSCNKKHASYVPKWAHID